SGSLVQPRPRAARARGRARHGAARRSRLPAPGGNELLGRQRCRAAPIADRHGRAALHRRLAGSYNPSRRTAVKCPHCGYDNKEDALSCNMCRAVLRKLKKAAPPPPPPPGEAPLDSPAAVRALVKHVLKPGEPAAQSHNAAPLNA